jgi:hypothetical protein
MLPWSFSEEAAAEKYMAQVQHNMWVTYLRTSVLSIITGGGKMGRNRDPHGPSFLYLSVLVSAEKKFWRCVQSGEIPHLINAEPPRPRIEAIRIVDMSSSNSWAEFAALFRSGLSDRRDRDPIKVARKFWKQTRIDEGRTAPEPEAEPAAADRTAISDGPVVDSQTLTWRGP